MSYGLTPRQMALLRFIRGYHLAHDGVSPTLAECAAGIGSANKSNAHRLLVEMEHRGAVHRLPGRARAIVILLPDVAVPVPAIGRTPLWAVRGAWTE